MKATPFEKNVLIYPCRQIGSEIISDRARLYKNVERNQSPPASTDSTATASAVAGRKGWERREWVSGSLVEIGGEE
jgi:hypothetical protein